MSNQLRCAIYTRKSSEEGLEQEFNSLDAQRESCEAFIVSQKHEGWKVIPAQYNDGGFSGGNMDRPALKQLLADIEAKSINVVVVYKVDRLTRSLADFAKIIEVFDKRGVSFVSVTQQFNTTSSMGRLTLNVLLSFAQFEREVTGERIRDKIAASKAKGMWMGGSVPMGYDVKDRKLEIDDKEAKKVRYIFEQYLQIRNIFDLCSAMEEQGIRTTPRTSRDGNKSGDMKISAGHMRIILTNQIYIGKIRHKDKLYDGEHQAIISQELWDAVQQQLADNRQGFRKRRNVRNPALFAGKIYDPEGNRLFTLGCIKGERYYRYYETPPELRKGPRKAKEKVRWPSGEIDRAICNRIAQFLNDEKALASELGLKKLDTTQRHKAIKLAKLLALQITTRTTLELGEIIGPHIKQVTAGNHKLSVSLNRNALMTSLKIDAESHDHDTGDLPLECECIIKCYGQEKRIIMPGEVALAKPETVETLKKALVRAHIWRDQLFAGSDTDIRKIAKLNGVTDRYAAFIIELAFLPPKLVENILNGNIPPDVNLQRLIGNTPSFWQTGTNA